MNNLKTNNTKKYSTAHSIQQMSNSTETGTQGGGRNKEEQSKQKYTRMKKRQRTDYTKTRTKKII